MCCIDGLNLQGTTATRLSNLNAIESTVVVLRTSELTRPSCTDWPFRLPMKLKALDNKKMFDDMLVNLDR